MKGLAAVLLALSLPISSVVGKQLAGPSARVVLITQTASATKAAATPSNPEPNFRWVGLGEEERRLEVNADFANKKENVAAILDAVVSFPSNCFQSKDCSKGLGLLKDGSPCARSRPPAPLKFCCIFADFFLDQNPTTDQ